MQFPNTPSSRRDPSPTRAWLLLVAMSCLQFFIAVDVTVVNIALPSIGEAFHVSGGALTWVMVGYTITAGGLLMLGGRLVDMFGRRRMLLTGTVVFGGASLVAGLAPTFELLVAARLVQGVGEAVALPAAMATIILLFPEGPARSKALGIWAAVASGGLVVGFALSGIITAFLGWRWIFLICLPFVLVVIIATLALLESDRPHSDRPVPLDVPGTVLLTACPLLFASGVVTAGESNTSWPIAVIAISGSIVTGVGFVRVERRAANPLIPLGFFSHPGRVHANLGTILLSAALSSSFLVFTFYLQDNLGVGPLESGLVMLPLAIALVAAALVAPRFMTRWGAYTCVAIGLASTAGAMVAIAVVTTVGAGPGWLLPAMILVAAGMGFGIIGLQYQAVSGTTEQDAGTASGVQRAADQLGGAAGTTLYIGIGFAPALHADNPFLVSCLLAILGLAAAAFIAIKAPKESPRK